MISRKDSWRILLVCGVFVCTEAEGQSIEIPEGDGRPVMTDGIFRQGEWEDALQIPIGNSAVLYLKEHRGNVYVGVRCEDLGKPFSMDLFLGGPNGQLHQLHASAQLGERVLSRGESEYPAWVWGHSPGWYANEGRWNQPAAEELITKGWSRDRAQREALFPQDGFEFQILRSKFPLEKWLMRLEIHSSPDYDRPLVFPVETSPIHQEGWMELSFSQGNSEGIPHG